MFHPLVFDNIRVVLEGAVYDRDFDGMITITGRSDVMDLATFQRRFQIDFQLAQRDGEDPHTVCARLQLATTLADIAAEQLEQPLTEMIGCTVCIHFSLLIQDVPQETGEIAEMLNRIWGNRPSITQTVKAILDGQRLEWPPQQFSNQVTLDFHRKINEGNIEDLRELLDYTVESLRALQAFMDQKHGRE